MSDTTNPAKQAPFKYKNSLEAFGDIGGSVVKNTASGLRDIGLGMFDQLMGNMPAERKNANERLRPMSEHRQPPRKIEKFNVFHHKKEEEAREIQSLKEQIKQEIKLMKQMDKVIAQDIKDIEKLAIDSSYTEATVYHVKFLELMITLLRNVRMKVNESHSWMQALLAKKQKRRMGSQKANMEPLLNSPQP